MPPLPPDSDGHRVRDAIEHPDAYGLRHYTGLVLAPLLLVLPFLLAAPAGLSEEGWRTAGVAMAMAVLWISEAIPIPATALLPLVLFPAFGLADGRAAATPYANPLIFLFLGGFLLALAMQKWGLHRRIALALIGALGLRPTRIIGGFLLASALVSMWVSNTATALMMLPIAASIVALIPTEERSKPAVRHFGIAVMLAVAYGSTTGGMATLIGTPPNALLAGFVDRTYGITIGFGQWMLLGVPVMLVTLPLVHLVITRVSLRVGVAELPGVRELLEKERAALGPFSGPEAIVAFVFALTALAWITRPLLEKWVPALTDTTIAMAGALLLFAIPVNLRRGQFVMDWTAARGLPWDVLILFGGGLSLAAQIQDSGLAEYLGSLATGLEGMPVLLLVSVFSFAILLLTELTSNTATAATFLPIAAAVATSLGQNPLLFLIPTALAANCSFMLPVGTPPNAIVFGSGWVTLPQMARAGFLLNLIMVPLIVLLVIALGGFVFDLQLDQLPAWVK